MGQNEVFEYLKSEESILVSLCLLGHVFTIIYLHNTSYCFIISLSILASYFILSKIKNKKQLFFTMMHYSFWSTLIESYIIYKCNNKCLKYGCNSSGINIPYWLFITYHFFVLGVMHFYKIFGLYFNN